MKFIEFLRQLVDAFRRARNKPTRTPGGRRQNPWPKCSDCHHRVPELCTSAEEGAEPCGSGIGCGCCTGPHRAPKPARGESDDAELRGAR